MLTISNANIEMFADQCSIASVDQPRGRREKLIDTMQIVEPRIRVPVPNHILDTKLFCKVADNGLIRVDPMVVHFAGFEPGRSFSRKVELQNMSTDIQQMHIIPPQTKYFKIKYTKNRRLVAGLVLPCLIEFFPDEWRYYYDCIRIHCKGEKNLVIPIHAYPVMNTSEFPQIIDFPAVPLGDTKTKVFPLRCHAPVDFEFQLTFLHPHPAFKVEPMAGIVPGSGEVDIRVSFSPTSFSSAIMKMQLNISQFLAQPLVCIVTGRCLPGMKSEILRASDHALESALLPQMTLDPTAISPLDRARSRKLKAKTPRFTSSGTISEPETQVIERDGVRIPADLSNPHSVGVVLNQKPGKLRVKDLRSTVFGSQVQAKTLTRQMKEAMFDVAIRKDVYSERQNQLRWQVKCGEDPVTAEFCSHVLGDREEAERLYQINRGDLDEEDECGRTVARLTWRRTRRLASMVALPVAAFDAYVNDLWFTRHAATNRFQQAARKVIVQRRVEPRLRALKELRESPELLNPDNTLTGSAGSFGRVDAVNGSVDESRMSVATVSSVTFPVYVSARQEDELVVSGPGVVPLKAQEIRLKEKVPYFALKVPQQYKLLGYRSFDVQEASSNYVPECLAKTLRTGAEDEVINLSADVDAKFGVIPSGANQSSSTEQGSEVTVLAPPKSMFQPVKYPALHIFNPVPGLMAFQSHLPYSETDPDFHLCPLPRYLSTDSASPHMATQKQYLDREEIIKGVMSWKKFPSPSIASLSGTPSFANVWVPRWKDPFSEDLLPFDVPPLFDSLPEDDKMGISEQIGGSGDNVVHLTPEMVRAQFATIDVNCLPEEEIQVKESKESGIPAVVIVSETGRLPASNLPFGNNGPIQREQRQSELDVFLRCKHGLLGRRIQSRISHINNLKKNKSLVPH